MGAGAPTITGRTAWQVLRLPAAEYAFVHARGDGFESTDPATGELVAELAASSAADVDDAVGAAVAAGQSGWRSNGELRARVLYGFAQALRADADRLAELLTREQGKTIHEAHIEIAGSAKMTEYYAGLDRKSTRLNSSHTVISYAVFCLKKKKPTKRSKQELNKVTTWRSNRRTRARTIGPLQHDHSRAHSMAISACARAA